jgi:putative aldouronate transport system substrate-binding protein
MFNLNTNPEFEDYRRPAEVAEFLNDVAARGMVPPAHPSLLMNDEELEFIKITQTPLDDYANTMQLKFIYGDADLDDDWDSYLKECRAKGSDEVVATINKAWARQSGR